MNKCSAVSEDGKQKIVSLSPFSAHWAPFMKLNQRYAQAKQLYQSYTLQQVLDILHHADNGETDYTAAIDNLFMKRQIAILNRQIAQIQEECRKWRDKYTDMLTKCNEEKMFQLYAEYEAFEANVSKEINSLKKQKKDLKANLKANRLDNVSYQRQLTPLKKRLSDLFARFGQFKYHKVREAFPDNEDITFTMIDTFVRNKQKENEEKQNDKVRQ